MTSRVSYYSPLEWPKQNLQNEIEKVQAVIGNLLTKEQIKEGIDLPRPQYGEKELPLTGVADQLNLTVFQLLDNVDPIIKLFELDEALDKIGGKESFLEEIRSADPSLASKISLYQLQRIDLEGVELLDPIRMSTNKIYGMNLEKFENIPDGSKPLYLTRMELEEKNGRPKGEFFPKSLGGIRQMDEEQLKRALPHLPSYAIKVLSKQQLKEIDFTHFSKRTLSDILSMRFCPLSQAQRELVKAKLYSTELTEEKN